MPYDHLIAANVMTLGVCQGHSSIAIFYSMLTSVLCGSSAIAELLVFVAMLGSQELEALMNGDII